jgi:pimeloyl-ACP methyl ester carboxylesterase
MAKKTPARLSDIRGFSRLAVDAVLGLADLAEAMHHNIARTPAILGTPTQAPAPGIAGLVYRSIREGAHLLGGGVDAHLASLIPLLDEPRSSPERDALLAALNGVLGDHLAASDNPLAITMRLRQDGQPLELSGPALVAAIPRPSGKVLLLVHGLCLSDLSWSRKGNTHAARMAADLGYTPIYLHYNTGLHISTNGRAFAHMLEALLHSWPVPVEELAIIGHSMGGLVARSACHYGAAAGYAWPRRLRTIVFLGTPHHGAPLERGGNWVNVVLEASPYTVALARLGKIRSAGITDLRYGNLLDQDWEDRDRFAHAGDQRQPVPLPRGVQCCTIGATTGKEAGDPGNQLLGDGLVPLRSALGYHPDPGLTLPFPESRQWIGYAMGHLDLLDRCEVYEQLREWLEPQCENRKLKAES